MAEPYRVIGVALLIAHTLQVFHLFVLDLAEEGVRPLESRVTARVHPYEAVSVGAFSDPVLILALIGIVRTCDGQLAEVVVMTVPTHYVKHV